MQPQDGFNPASIPTNATEVKYHRVSIPTIPSGGVFVHLTQLKKLWLIYTGTKTIEPEAFRGLSNLTDLSIRYTGISHLEPGSFAHLDSLETVNFFGSHLNESFMIPEIWSDVSDTLIELNLVVNRFSRLSRDMFTLLNFTKLEKLVLADNRITDVEPGSFPGLPSLTRLFLNGNRISTLFPKILFH